jgi:tetratricopeptide (TPR) repeat protein
LATAERAVRLEPLNPVALVRRGAALLLEERYDDAYEAAARLWYLGTTGDAQNRLSPTVVRKLYFVGRDEDDAGKYDAALHRFEQCLALHAEDAPCHYSIAVTLQLLKRHDEAVQHASAARTADPALLTAREIVLDYMRSSRQPMALELWSLIIEGRADEPRAQAHAYEARALLLRELGRGAEAQADLIKACDLDYERACILARGQ